MNKRSTAESGLNAAGTLTRLQRRRCLLALAAPLLLAGGCATAPDGQPEAAARPQHWSGRLALTIASEPPEQFFAAFDLRGSADRGELELYSPLGSTLAQLRWQPGRATLDQGGRQHEFHSLDELATAAAGTPIPVQRLFAWLQGDALEAGGWRPDLSQLQQGRIRARRDQPGPPAQLRLVLDPS